MEEANKTYLQSCHYHPERDPYCPVFRIQDMVSLAGENFTQLAVRGGVIVVSIDWYDSFSFYINNLKCIIVLFIFCYFSVGIVT